MRYRLIAAELHDLGIDSNCAPMVDIAGPDTHTFLRNRCYGTDVETVVRLGRAAAEGMLAGGVIRFETHSRAWACNDGQPLRLAAGWRRAGGVDRN